MTSQQEKKAKVERLREQRDKLNSQIRQIEAHEVNRKRRDDTRRKVLIGAAIMARVQNEKDGWTEDRLLAMMDNFLSRPRERDLFGLEPLTTQSTEKAQNSPQEAESKSSPQSKPTSPSPSPAVNIGDSETDSAHEKNLRELVHQATKTATAITQPQPAEKLQGGSISTTPTATKKRLPELDDDAELEKEFNI